MSKKCLLYSIAIVAHFAALLTSVALCYMYATTILREDHGRVEENNQEKINYSKLDCFGKLVSLEKHIQNTLLLLVEGGMFYEVEQICYKAYGNGYAWTWESASAHCKGSKGTYGNMKNGNLAAISSWKISNFLQKVLTKEMIGNGLWIGAHKVDGQWQWSNGDNWEFEKWLPNEPNNDSSAEENYVRIDSNQGWNDYYDTNSYFLCEWKM